mmetsp:Transcript_10863/g.16194  ORF Transcript_10863/g.16194 Transcript_10863/m.16194 type:complete len:411 (-) Transcript_10863:217-1449(-)
MGGQIRYVPSEWYTGKIVITFTMITLSMVFTFFHVCHMVQTSRVSRLKRIISLQVQTVKRNLQRDIIISNAFVLFVAGPSMIATSFMDVDSNPTVCKWVDIPMTQTYIWFNFLTYRTLISKATVYDAMMLVEEVRTRVFWFTHIINALIIAAVAYSQSQREWEIIIENGEAVCIYKDTGLIDFLAPLLVALVDLSVSFACLYLLSLPLIRGNYKKKQIGASRNFFWAVVAIASTLCFLIFNTVGYLYPPPHVNLRIFVGAIDSIFNLVSVNMCWPLLFYQRVILKLFGYNTKTPGGSPSNNSRISRNRKSKTRHERKATHTSNVLSSIPNGKFSLTTSAEKIRIPPEILASVQRSSVGLTQTSNQAVPSVEIDRINLDAQRSSPSMTPRVRIDSNGSNMSRPFSSVGVEI